MRKLDKYITTSNTRRAAAGIMLAYLAMSFHGWLPSRVIPMFPALDILQFPETAHHFTLALFITGLNVLLIRPNTWLTWSAIALGILMITIDLNRFHPIMLHVLVLLMVSAKAKPTEIKLAIRWMLAITYLFSVAHRIHSEYHLPFVFLFPQGTELYVVKITAGIITLIEFMTAIVLIQFPRSKSGLLLSLFINAGIVITLLVNRYNYSAVLWNVAIATLAIFCLPTPGTEDEEGLIPWSALKGVGVILILATLGFLKLINPVFSFSLYNSRMTSAILTIYVDQMPKLPEPYRNHIGYLGGDQSLPYVDLGALMVQEYNMIMYPAEANFRNSVKPLQALPFDNEELMLLVRTGKEIEIGKGVHSYFKNEF